MDIKTWIVGILMSGFIFTVNASPSAEFVDFIEEVAFDSQYCAEAIGGEVGAWDSSEACIKFRQNMTKLEFYDFGDGPDANFTTLLATGLEDETIEETDVFRCLYNLDTIAHNIGYIAQTVEGSKI